MKASLERLHSSKCNLCSSGFQDKDLAELSNRECLLGSANNMDATSEVGDNYSNAVMAAQRKSPSKRPLSAADGDSHRNTATVSSVAYQHVASSSSLRSSVLQTSSACNSNSAGETDRLQAGTGTVCHSYSEQSPVHLRSFAPLSSTLRPSIRIIEAEV